MQHLDAILLLVELAKPERLGVGPHAEHRAGGRKGDGADGVRLLHGGEALEAQEAVLGGDVAVWILGIHGRVRQWIFQCLSFFFGGLRSEGSDVRIGLRWWKCQCQ